MKSRVLSAAILLTTFGSEYAISSEAAKPAISREDQSIAAELSSIPDEAHRELVWSKALVMTGGVHVDEGDLITLIRNLKNHSSENIQLIATMIEQLPKTREEAVEIATFVRGTLVPLLATERYESFITGAIKTCMQHPIGRVMRRAEMLSRTIKRLDLENLYISLLLQKVISSELEDELIDLSLRLGAFNKGYDLVCGNLETLVENTSELAAPAAAVDFLEALDQKLSVKQCGIYHILSDLKKKSAEEIQQLKLAVQALRVEPDFPAQRFLDVIAGLTHRNHQQVTQVVQIGQSRELNAFTLDGLMNLMPNDGSLLTDQKIESFIWAIETAEQEKLPGLCIDTLARLDTTCDRNELILGMRKLSELARRDAKLSETEYGCLIRSISTFKQGSLTAAADFMTYLLGQSGRWNVYYTSLFLNLLSADAKAIAALPPICPKVLATGLDDQRVIDFLFGLATTPHENPKQVIDEVCGRIQAKQITEGQIPFVIRALKFNTMIEIIDTLHGVSEMGKQLGWSENEINYFVRNLPEKFVPHLGKLLPLLQKMAPCAKWQQTHEVNNFIHTLPLNDDIEGFVRVANIMVEFAEPGEIMVMLKAAPLRRLFDIPEANLRSAFGDTLKCLKEHGLSLEYYNLLTSVAASWTEAERREHLPQFVSLITGLADTSGLAEPGNDQNLLIGLLSIDPTNLPQAIVGLLHLNKRLPLNSARAIPSLMHVLARAPLERVTVLADDLIELVQGKKIREEAYGAILAMMATGVHKDRWVPLVNALELILGPVGTPDPEDVDMLLTFLDELSPKRFDEVVAYVLQYGRMYGLNTEAAAELVEAFGRSSKKKIEFAFKTLPLIVSPLSKEKDNNLNDEHTQEDAESMSDSEKNDHEGPSKKLIQVDEDSSSESIEEGPSEIIRSLLTAREESVPEIIDCYKALREPLLKSGEAPHTTLFGSLCISPGAANLTALTKTIIAFGNEHQLSEVGTALLVRVLSRINIDNWDSTIGLLKSVESFLGGDETLYNLRTIIFCGLDVLSETEFQGYLQQYIKLYKEDPEIITSGRIFGETGAEGPVLRHVLTIAIADKGRFQAIENHWRQIMTAQDHFSAEAVCAFIERHALELGYDEEDQFIQQVRRVQSVLEDGDENGAHTIFERMKEKRLVPVDWATIKRPQAQIAGLNWRLNPEKIAEFGLSQKMDLSSVPQLKSPVWIEMVQNLKTALTLEANGLLLDMAARVYRTTQPGYDTVTDTVPEQTNQDHRTAIVKIVQQSTDPKDHYCLLLESSWHNLEGAKMRCVTNYFIHMDDGEAKWLRLCQFIAGVRGCLYGRDTAIQDYYIGLPSQFRLKTMGTNKTFDHDKREAPAMAALFSAMQSVVSMQFSPESGFMKEVCGVQIFDSEFDYAAHQINWMKGLIGDRVGLSEGPRFDIHVGTVNKLIRERPLQQVMEMYYQRLELQPIVTLMHTAFNQLFAKAEARRRSEEKQEGEPSIYQSVLHIFEVHKKSNPAEVFTSDNKAQYPWVKQNFANEDDVFGRSEFTPRAIVRLMGREGLLDEITDPLGF